MKRGYNIEAPGACIPYHNKSKMREHGIWRGILQRCYNPKRVKYKIYGERGITVCERWLEPQGKGFKNFLSDMGNSPSKEHSIERIDNDKGYSPENCKWATKKDQARNRTTSKWIEYKGERKTLAEWAENSTLEYGTILARLYKGWSVEKAMETPVMKTNCKTQKN